MNQSPHLLLIANDCKHGESLVGSDVTYADMQPIAAKHTHNVRVRDESIRDALTYVSESLINNCAGSAYARPSEGRAAAGAESG